MSSGTAASSGSKRTLSSPLAKGQPALAQQHDGREQRDADDRRLDHQPARGNAQDGRIVAFELDQRPLAPPARWPPPGATRLAAATHERQDRRQRRVACRHGRQASSRPTMRGAAGERRAPPASCAPRMSVPDAPRPRASSRLAPAAPHEEHARACRSRRRPGRADRARRWRGPTPIERAARRSCQGCPAGRC